MPCHVLEGPVNGLRHIDEKLAGVGRSVHPEERCGPAIEIGVWGQRREEARETGPLFRGVSKRMGPSKILNIDCSEVGRRVVELHGAFEAKLRGSFRETSGRDMVAEDIPCPVDLARRGRNFEFGFEHLLVLVVTWTQHHPVLAERDRLLIVVCCDVSDSENRHCGPTLMQATDDVENSQMAGSFRARNRARLSLCAVAGSTSANADEWDAPRPVGCQTTWPAVIAVHAESGLAPFLIAVDHAGNSIPRALGQLGVPETELERHIAWDIGIAAVSRFMADALDATLVQQNYSRLVIDCNRAPGSETSIPEISELTPIPGNIGWSEDRKGARVREIFRPYHHRIATEQILERRHNARELSARKPEFVCRALMHFSRAAILKREIIILCVRWYLRFKLKFSRSRGDDG